MPVANRVPLPIPIGIALGFMTMSLDCNDKKRKMLLRGKKGH
jgi:hypothetical protein